MKSESDKCLTSGWKPVRAGVSFTSSVLDGTGVLDQVLKWAQGQHPARLQRTRCK